MSDEIERLHIERPAWPDPEGELVRYSDHVAALAEKDARIAELELLVASKIKSVRDITIEASRAECEGLRAEQIDAAAKHLRETMQAGKNLNSWYQTPKSTKKKWLALAEGTMRAALGQKETGDVE